ncbi:MAG TPA: FmdB family zinc ribbon protein [Actinomycetota bacterium]|nr:FmdB family zinc ribbon protein [Actinomycetota bacterium]
MPTYEYACKSCGRHLEVQQSFSDAPLETCESCGGQLKRVFHPVGIVLKGSGFYATDNRGGKKTAATSATDAKSDTKSDSTSDTKSESSTPSSEKSSSTPKDSGAAAS